MDGSERIRNYEKATPCYFDKDWSGRKSFAKVGRFRLLGKTHICSSKFRVYFLEAISYTVTEKIKQRRRMVLKVKFERKV